MNQERVKNHYALKDCDQKCKWKLEAVQKQLQKPAKSNGILGYFSTYRTLGRNNNWLEVTLRKIVK